MFALDLDSIQLIDFGVSSFNHRIITDSVNGLILVVSDNLILWNPSTKRHKELPSTSVEYSTDFEVSTINYYGFGYDSKSDDYKIVRVIEIGRDVEDKYLLSETKVFSLKSNSWEKVSNFAHRLPWGKRVSISDDIRLWGVYVNDALHTFLDYSEHIQCIMAFNLSTYEHYQIPIPHLIGDNSGVANISVLDGSLTALVGRKMNTTEIWTMREYGVKESWVRLLSFMPQIAEPYGDLIPLMYIPNAEHSGGKELLLIYDDRCLIAYNLNQRRSRILNIPGIYSNPRGFMYVS